MDFKEKTNKVLENLQNSDNPILQKIAKLDEICMVVDSCEFDPVTFKVNEEKYCCFSVNSSDAKYQATSETAKRKPGYNQFDFGCISLTPSQMAGFIVAIHGGIAFADGETFELVEKETIENLLH